MIKINVNLDAIPQASIWQNKKGERMATLVVTDRREKDEYGNTHTVYINQTEEARTKGEPKVYVGKGKEYKFKQ